MTANLFLSGAVAMASLTIAAFFLRFWIKTRDRLFLFFSATFLILMGERLLRTFLNLENELAPFVYSIRLVAFLLLIAAIVDKNRRS